MITAGGMAYQRLKSEDSDKENADGTRQMDIISQLEGVPHVLEDIFLHLDTATDLETVKVSTTWKRLFSSLNLWKCVWMKNMRMSSTWKNLSARMEQLRGGASSYQEACRYVQGNIRRISQSRMKNINFRALADENGAVNSIASVIRTNDKYVFIGDDCKVRIVDRWTRKRIKDLVCHFGHVTDLQVNDRFLVVQLHSENVGYDQVDVYDAQKLTHIQTIETNKMNPWSFGTKLALGSDVLVISEISKPLVHLMFHFYRWNPSAARFVTEDRLTVDYLSANSRIYVNEKYLIVDSSLWGAGQVRLIQVFSLETMQLVRERQFADSQHDGVFKHSIRKEYHDGAMVVQTQSCVALWDVDKDTLQPMADHPKQFQYSFAMAHHPFQIVVEKIENPQQLLLVPSGRPTKNSLIAVPSQCCVHSPDFDLYYELFYFDGLQMLTDSQHRSMLRYEIVIADLVV